VVLEQIGEDVEAARRGRQRRLGSDIGAVRQREALLAFDEVGAAGKAARGEARGEQPVLRRLAGVERLAHRAELRFEAGRLRAGDAECPGGRISVEAEQVCTGRRGAQRADRAGRVKAAVVMAWLERHADAAGDLVAGDKRGGDLTPGTPALLGERDEARQDRHRRMPRHRQIDVVVIQRVADRAIDERGRQGGQARRVADDAGLRRAAGLGQFVEQHRRERVVGPGERDTVIIEHALARQFPHRLGQAVIRDRARLVGQGAGQIRRFSALYDIAIHSAAPPFPSLRAKRSGLMPIVLWRRRLLRRCAPRNDGDI